MGSSLIKQKEKERKKRIISYLEPLKVGVVGVMHRLMKELQTGSKQWRSNKEREESDYRRSQKKKIKAVSAEETEAGE